MGDGPISLRIGTRGSKLALAQATKVREMLGGEAEIVTIKTSGDKGDRDKLGAFVREIQDALLNGSVDVAVHCLKDIPTQGVPGLRFSAYLAREDVRDTLISRATGLTDLPPGAIVGTGSVRRTSQLASIRPDLCFKPLVGNVDTRLRKLMDGEYDAIVIALAGLKRLGMLGEWESLYPGLQVHALEPEVMLPAPGQAVLVLETRGADAETHGIVSRFDHLMTRICADAERAFLEAFGGGCSTPVAALGRVDALSLEPPPCPPPPAHDSSPQGEDRPSLSFSPDGQLELQGLVAAPDGKRVLRGVNQGETAKWRTIAAELAEQLKAQGAMDLFTFEGAAR